MSQIKIGICRLRVTLALDRDILLCQFRRLDPRFWPFFLSNVDWHYGSLARSVPKPLKVPSLARSVPKPLLIELRGAGGHQFLWMTSLSQSSGEAGGHQPSSLPSLSTPYQLVVSEVKWSEVKWWMMIHFWSFIFPETNIYYRSCIYLKRYKRKMCTTILLWV